jgi:3-hydroxyacyl-CoA dehydrogenase
MPALAPVTMATRPSKLDDDTTAVRVAILGAGLMGAQIGCEYALGGHEVVLHARDSDAAQARADSGFGLLRDHGLRAEEELVSASGRVSASADPAAAAEAADLIVESLPEDFKLKASVLNAALPAAPKAIMATNTSSLSIAALGEAIGRPQTTVGTHYLNPPLLMPTVEVIAGADTTPETMAFAREQLLALGKLPVIVRRDTPGFVWNRLQFALVRECAWLVENGVTSPDDIDTVVRDGLARRWREVGPLRSIALGGLNTWNRSGRNIVPELSTAAELPDLAAVAITGGDLAGDAARRDAALARELRDERGAW